MAKGYVRSAGFGGAVKPSGRIEDANRKLLATIVPDGVILNAARATLGSVSTDYLIRDDKQDIIGQITAQNIFLDNANRVIAHLLPDWRLVGPTEQLLAIIKAGVILGTDHNPVALYSQGMDTKHVLTWFIFFSGLTDLSTREDMTIR